MCERPLPKLDDWVDGKPDAWDYEAVLREHNVSVYWWADGTGDVQGNESPAGNSSEWAFSWRFGFGSIGPTNETIARKAAALFVSLWLRGVSASFADKLMDGFICYLERQENTSLTFLAEVDTGDMTGHRYFRLTRERFCRRESFEFHAEEKIIKALGFVADDEEIIVTFVKVHEAIAARGSSVVRGVLCQRNMDLPRGIQEPGGSNTLPANGRHLHSRIGLKMVEQFREGAAASAVWRW
jgi:hypothetical protein